MTNKSAKKRHGDATHTQTAAQQLAECNAAYTQGAFKYLRVLVHTLGMAQFIYAAYYQWFKVHWLQEPQTDDEIRAHWGGKLKFLTFLDVLLQAAYHFLALLNDLFGSNLLDIKSSGSLLRKLRDYVFATWAFPVAHNVCISFWVIYAYDRELIFPAALDAIFPSWLNHVVHTNVAMLAILDMFTCFRQYPSRWAGLGGLTVFMSLYIGWLHIVRHYSGQWVYPILEVLSMPARYLMLSALLAFSVLLYFVGEALNNVVWAPELKLLQRKCKHK